MNEREALEKIANLPKDANARISGGKGIDKRIAMANHYIARQAIKIAREALAPQECKTAKGELVEVGEINLCQFCKYLGEHSECEKPFTYILFIQDFFKDLEKQLHSQEKTFTVEEIKGIIEKVVNKGCGMSTTSDLLAEFEKAM